MPSKTHPPDKVCVVCGRTITWRKKWERDWEQVRYCSDACRRAKGRPVDAALEEAILTLLSARPNGATITPSDAAQAVALEDWHPLEEPARAAARRLASRGEVEILQNTRVVPDPSHARGPIRIRRPR